MAVGGFVKKVLGFLIIGLLFWLGIKHIQSWSKERAWNQERQELVDKYVNEIAIKDTTIQKWIEKAEKHSAELQGWYEITGVYDPMQFEGIGIIDTIFIQDTIRRRISFEIDTGSIYMQVWTTFQPPKFNVNLEIDPLTIRLGIVRDNGRLVSDYVQVSDPLFSIERVEIKQLWEDEIAKPDWFGWLLGGQLFSRKFGNNIEDYEIGVLGGVRLGRASILAGIDSRDFKSLSVLREF